MKIYDNGRIPPLQPYSGNAVHPKAGRGNPAGGNRDELSISPEALEMSRGMPQTDPEPLAADRKRVEEIKQSVRNGTYEVDIRKVADKIARHLLGE